MQTHQSQTRLTRFIEQEMIRINQQQQGTTSITSQCQELLEKTSDLMNTVCRLVSLIRMSNSSIFYFSQQ